MSDKRLLVNAGWNYFPTIVEGLVGLVLVTYIARQVTPAEYGLALFTLGVAEVFMLLDIGLFGLLPRGYLSERARPDGKPMLLVGSAVLATAALGVLAGGATIGIGSAIVAFRPPQDAVLADQIYPTILATGAFAALMFPGHALARVYEAESRFRLLSIINVGLALVRGVLTIAFIRADFGAPGIVVAAVGVALLRLVVLISPAALRRAGMPPIDLRWDWPRLRPAWRLGGWALADNIAHHISFGIDALVLFALGSPRAVALFGVAQKIPTHASLAVEKAVAVALPAMAEHHVVGARSETARLFVVLTRYTFAAVLPVVVIGAVVAKPLLTLWVGPTYAEAALALRWLLAATLGISIAVPCITALYAVNAVATDAKIAIVEAVANLGLTIALVPTYGATGAAFATAVAHLGTTFFWLLPVTCRKVELSYAQLIRHVTRGVALPCLCAAVVLVISRLATTDSDHVYRLAGGALAGMVYCAALWLHWRPRAVHDPLPS